MGYRLDLAATARRGSSEADRPSPMLHEPRGNWIRRPWRTGACWRSTQRNDRAHRGLEGARWRRTPQRHGRCRPQGFRAQGLRRRGSEGCGSSSARIRGSPPRRTWPPQITAARGPTTVAPRLKTKDNRKVTLQFRDAPTKMVFEVLSRETGINFILDKDIKSDGKTTIFVQDVPVEEAIDLVLDQNSLARQILVLQHGADLPEQLHQAEGVPGRDRPHFLHHERRAEGRRDHAEDGPRRQDVVHRRARQCRGHARHARCRPHGRKTRRFHRRCRSRKSCWKWKSWRSPAAGCRTWAFSIRRTATLSPTSLAAAARCSSGGLVLSDLAHQNSHTITVTPLSVTLNAMKQTGLTNTLASPRIRARNKEKAKILIGSRVPVITNSVTPTAAGTARSHRQRSIPRRGPDARSAAYDPSGQRRRHQDQPGGELAPQADYDGLRYDCLRDRNAQRPTPCCG